MTTSTCTKWCSNTQINNKTTASPKTGQALYSVVQDEAGEDSHGNQHCCFQHGINRVRGGAQLHEADTTMDQLYAQVDKKKSKKKDALATNPHPSKADTAMDQLYAQVE